MRTGISDNIHTHSFSGGICGHLHCKHHLQICLAVLQTSPSSATGDTEERKRTIYRKTVQYMIFTVLTYYSLNFYVPA